MEAKAPGSSAMSTLMEKDFLMGPLEASINESR